MQYFYGQDQFPGSIVFLKVSFYVLFCVIVQGKRDFLMNIGRKKGNTCMQSFICGLSRSNHNKFKNKVF